MNLVYLEKPEGFNPKMEVVSCFVESNGEILLLHRQDHKPQGNTWGRPSGKVDKNESKESALIRELFEEVGMLVGELDLGYNNNVFVRYPDFDFIYHIFSVKVPEKFDVTINKEEHKDWKWVTPEEALEHDLIPGESECIRHFYNLK